MKKVFCVLSLCAVISPPTFAESISNADTKGNQTLSKTDLIVTPAPVANAATDTKPDQYPLLKNLSGTMALVTNYVFRGVSQSRNLPAVQGGLTYTFPINLYLNVWGSNVNFTSSNGSVATVEFDTLIGYRNTYGDNLSYDISVARYNYPGARFANYNEINGVLNYYIFQAGISYSANVYNVHKGGTYYTGGINYDIPSRMAFGLCNLNLLAMMGHYTLPRAAGNSYNDYNIQLSKGFNNYSLIVQWTGNNGRQFNSPYDDNQLIGQIAASF
jgi:uncharacterized protein (TIGR02001 family)